MTATGAQPAAVIGLTHLALTQFRNYRHLALELGLQPVVLVGVNGAGKTNLLEAISLLGPGSGLHRAKLSEIDFRGPGNQANMAWAVHAKVQTAGGEFALGTGRDPLAQTQTGRDRRLARINGAPARSQADFADILSVQWLVPAMDGLFDDAASARRRYLDRLVTGIDSSHAARIAGYESAMRERARLLRGEVGAAPADLDAWLDALEAEMSGSAVAIAASRCEAVDALNLALADGDGPFPRASLAATGAVEAWLTEGPALAAEEKLRAQLKAARASDAASGVTEWGTHRSDLDVVYLGRSLGTAPLRAAECSTGEQRALLLSIALAEARLTKSRRGEAPILLLDEAVSHLDGQRREALFAEILALGLQAWLTGTDRDLFRPLIGHAQFFAVEDGRIHNL
ncbi:DNA replication/repair protein RecF [Dongia deserti]|uniref:DNA replication/repair protein RecF n=1 Tax=Dongia deserti TaxID=2268030 RepID=UPI000E64A694|nr:DNA replication/repair protein RecF [Dongia deserti]